MRVMHGKRLAHADDRMHALGNQCLGFAIDFLVRLAEQAATLGMTDDAVLRARLLQHADGDLAGVCAGFLPIAVLCAQGDVRLIEIEHRPYGLDVKERRADDDIDALFPVLFVLV